MLTTKEIQGAKPKTKPYRLSDGGRSGLVLDVRPSGEKFWRLRCSIDGRETFITLGRFPDMGAAEAREESSTIRRRIREGADPRAQRGQGVTFKDYAKRYLAERSARWVPGHKKRLEQRLERHVYSRIGNRPIAELRPAEILAMARKVAAAGAVDTSHRLVGLVGEVCRFALAEGACEFDPTRDLKGVLPVAKPSHRPAITDPKTLGRFMKDLRGANQLPADQRALLLGIVHTFQRPGEVRMMAWASIEAALWRFTASKTGLAHAVPLSTQMLGLLAERRAVVDEALPYVFPGRGGAGCLSNPMPSHAIDAMGWDTDTVSAHGFRATARTMLAERLGADPRLIELQLGHAPPEVHGRAYNRALYINQRTDMMQRWSDYLDTLAAAA